MPLWLFLALLVPFIIGIVNVIDKVIIERYAPTIYFYAFWIGLFEIPIGGLTLLGLSFDQPLEARAVWGGILAGVVRSFSFLGVLAALRQGQLARVAPIYYMSPLVVALMSATFLNEELTGMIWGAIALVVLGAGLVSWQGRGSGGGWSHPQAQALAACAAVLFATADTLSKFFLDEEVSFWQFLGASRLGTGLIMIAVVSMADVRRRGLGMIGHYKFIGFIILTEIMVTGSMVASLGAISMGPLSRVSAIRALLPVVVLVYSIMLARLIPSGFASWITTRTLATQAAGVAAIVSAVVIISLE